MQALRKPTKAKDMLAPTPVSSATMNNNNYNATLMSTMQKASHVELPTNM